MSQAHKVEHEQQIIGLFCAWYQQQRGESCEFIRLASPPAPDAAIRVEGREIHVELARYRENCPHNELFPYDQALKQAIFDRSMVTSDLPHCTPILRYREESPGQYTIPPKPEHDKFIEELFAFVRHFTLAGNAKFLEVNFIDESEIARFRRRITDTRVYAASQDYPLLGKFCRAVVIHCHPSLRMGLPTSSMNSRGTAIDFDSITATVTEKLKRLPSYRTAIGNKRLWLLYYSEGYPPTARLPGPDHNEQVLSHIRTICQTQQYQFDAVWWADCMYMHGGPTVFRVV
jgi:hypothetical protein